MSQQIIRKIALGLLLIMGVSCHQERMVFHPESLAPETAYEFMYPHEELSIAVEKEVELNGLLFRTQYPRGLVFYLHGNSGNLKSWGKIADLYLENDYDFFIYDYRSFGKSDGVIDQEQRLLADNQIVYDSIVHGYNYEENKVVIIGYSIGTCFAAKLAAENGPMALVLKAPYYSIPNLINQSYKLVPHFIIKYKLPTYQYLPKVKAPVTIFHGDKDPLIPIKSSYKLAKGFKENDTLIVLPGNDHHGFHVSPIYQLGIQEILNDLK